MDNNIKQKSRALAAKLIQLQKQLSARKMDTIISEKLLSSGAEAGAELSKAEYALGKNDLITKTYKSLQDCAEAKYWLELLNDSKYLTEFEFNDILKDLNEMGKLLIAYTKTLRTG